tara:strand:+ start:113 stop:328 length:216 start_codon:yes stop_codon:yes gene_type:complete
MTDKQLRYIKVRIDQLKDDQAKAHDAYDKQWYNRCIQELDWVLQMDSKPTHNCYMSGEITSDAAGFKLSNF